MRSIAASTCFDCDVADDHPDVQLTLGAEELENVYGSAKLRKEVTAHKLEQHQIELEDFQLGTGESPIGPSGWDHQGYSFTTHLSELIL